MAEAQGPEQFWLWAIMRESGSEANAPQGRAGQ